MPDITTRSVFQYDAAENRVTAALLHICKLGGVALLREFATIWGLQLPSPELQIHSQVKEKASTPDGTISADFEFKIYLESKLTTDIAMDQLRNHSELAGAGRSVVYLTPHAERPSELPLAIQWSSWEKVDETLQSFAANPGHENREALEFLSEQFSLLVAHLGLVQERWVPSPDQVLIVAGSWAEADALLYSYYVCQNRRRFRPSEYIAFYKEGVIKHIFQIDGPPHDDVDPYAREEFKEQLTADPSRFTSGELLRLFKLKGHQELSPVVNDLRDKNGNLCPFTYGQPRYTTLAKLRSARRTSDL